MRINSFFFPMRVEEERRRVNLQIRTCIRLRIRRRRRIKLKLLKLGRGSAVRQISGLENVKVCGRRERGHFKIRAAPCITIMLCFC